MVNHDAWSLLTYQQPAQIEIGSALEHLLELLSGYNAKDLEVKIVKVQSRLS